MQRLCIRLVLDLGIALEDMEHVVDVDHGLLDLAIEHAHEIQRDVELNQHRVDEHEIADRRPARRDIARDEQHQDRHADGEDHRLAGIEDRERGIGLRRGLLVAFHGAVVARGLPRLGAEILDRLVVEERIDGLRVGVGIGVVHPLPERHPPLGRLVGIGEIDRHHGEHDERVEPVELPGEDAEDEDELDDGRDELQDEEPRQFLDAVAAPFEDARQAARLALEVEAQREPMHVLEGLHRELAHRVHGDLGEEAVANLAQERHGDARQPVECREQERRPPQPGTRRHCRFAPLPCLDRRVTATSASVAHLNV